MGNEIKTDVLIKNATPEFFNQLDVLKFFLNDMTEEEQKNFAIFMRGVEFAKSI